jgi:hypothetical protein
MPHGNDPPPTGSNGDAATRQRRRTPARLIVPSAVDPARLNRRRVAGETEQAHSAMQGSSHDEKWDADPKGIRECK